MRLLSWMLRIISKIKRPLSDEERRKLRHIFPSFLSRGRRKVAQQELDEGMAEVLDFEVARVWNMNDCRPPCCPHIYLFQASETEFVYAESWTAFNNLGIQFPRRKMRIVRSPFTKRILSIDLEGEVLPLEDNCFDPVTDHFDHDAECEVLKEEDMSEEARFMLNKI